MNILQYLQLSRSGGDRYLYINYDRITSTSQFYHTMNDSKEMVNILGTLVLWATLNLGRLLVNFQESIPFPIETSGFTGI